MSIRIRPTDPIGTPDAVGQDTDVPGTPDRFVDMDGLAGTPDLTVEDAAGGTPDMGMIVNAAVHGGGGGGGDQGGGGEVIATRTWDTDGFDGLIDWMGTEDGTRAFANPAKNPSAEVVDATQSDRWSSTSISAALDVVDQSTAYFTANGVGSWWRVWFGGHDRYAILDRIAIRAAHDAAPRNFRIEGWEVGATDWTVLKTIAGEGPNANAWWSTDLDGVTQLIGLRIVQTGNNTSGNGLLRFANFEMWGTYHDTHAANRRVFDVGGFPVWDWTAAGEPSEVDVLCVAGGGAGGSNRGGGGGAGGVLETLAHAVAGDVNITVGRGGLESSLSGADSVFDALTATGGGGGGNNGASGKAGGSGGGAGVNGAGGAGTSGQGFAGGEDLSSSGGGGGGASEVGGNAPGSGVGGAGGDGLTMWDDLDVGGGGGGGGYPNAGGAGGFGGGGDGQGNNGTPSKKPGVPGTGGGGGGGSNNTFPGMPGGAGLVAVRWS